MTPWRSKWSPDLIDGIVDEETLLEQWTKLGTALGKKRQAKANAYYLYFAVKKIIY
jgi:hypothetical protein